MSDLIKREDAIEALCRGCGWKESQCDKDSGFWCESGALIRQDIPSADRPQEWIPCSERLPSKGVAVLVNGTMYDAPPITISTDAPYYYEQGWINAWMPLPEPWKGADSE